MPAVQLLYRFDLFAALLLAGVVQGAFLSILFISKPHKQPYHYLGLSILTMTFALVVLEVFLGYSGLITNFLAFVDFSEPLNFVIGPATYLLIKSLSGIPLHRKALWHYLPFLLYSLYHLSFILQDPEVKLNAYLYAFHPELPRSPVLLNWTDDPLRIRQYLEVLTLLHISIYLLLSFKLARNRRTESSSHLYFFSWVKGLLAFYALTVIVYLVIRLAYQNDLGDHLISTLITVQLFFINYKVFTDSAFFQPMASQAKYARSSLDQDSKSKLIQKLKSVEETKFYLEPSASLQSLAKQISTTPHALSQVLNEVLGKNFFEYLAELRIKEAQQMLLQKETQHLKIEEIAERIGYQSKSAFNAAFKKYTGLTPSTYKKEHTTT